MGTAFFSRFFALELSWKRDRTRGMPRTFAAAEVKGAAADRWTIMERPFGRGTWVPQGHAAVQKAKEKRKAVSAGCGNGLRDDERKGVFFYRMGFMNRGIRPPSTMKMAKAAIMTPEMTGTCTGSASSAGLSQYMERMTLK